MFDDAEMKQMGFSREASDGDARTYLREATDGGPSAMVWFRDQDGGGEMAYFTLCDPQGNIIAQGYEDTAEGAESQIKTLSKAVDKYSFKEGSIERKRDDALVLNSDPRYYIQVTQKSSGDISSARFISRSQSLRKTSPETRGRLGTCDDVLAAVRIIDVDIQAAKPGTAMRRPLLKSTRTAGALTPP